MSEQNSYTISKADLRKLLINYKISEDTIARFFGELEKSHRHINALAFVSILEKSGVDLDNIVNILRRLGMDDVRINNILNDEDEQKLAAEPGRIFNASVEFSAEDEVNE
ncbi:hypothetical protein Mia14_0739 [Candidatus Mancarchaeum acidiphilum]|uniref:Uncharacterized protein n=1 Tax=Candidatus Mancarchaeum acidiphilum TaxID=1920749 RepID=A0A218NNH6_9ARCH|nr:hypothetical protein [Candidatus Mancarchaeum acidiphilum]ASI14037.1 hypothetical protein Mia14_0739 [Candidatus Mancarchaeum acidiphilum]